MKDTPPRFAVPDAMAKFPLFLLGDLLIFVIAKQGSMREYTKEEGIYC